MARALYPMVADATPTGPLTTMDQGVDRQRLRSRRTRRACAGALTSPSESQNSPRRTVPLASADVRPLAML